MRGRGVPKTPLKHHLRVIAREKEKTPTSPPPCSSASRVSGSSGVSGPARLRLQPLTRGRGPGKRAPGLRRERDWRRPRRATARGGAGPAGGRARAGEGAGPRAARCLPGAGAQTQGEGAGHSGTLPFAGWRQVVPGGAGEGRRGEDEDPGLRGGDVSASLAAALAPKPDSAHFLALGGGYLPVLGGGW